jgi:hypothetical protein
MLFARAWILAVRQGLTLGGLLSMCRRAPRCRPDWVWDAVLHDLPETALFDFRHSCQQNAAPILLTSFLLLGLRAADLVRGLNQQGPD